MIGTTFNELQRLQYNNDRSLENARDVLQSTFEEDTDEYIAAMYEAWPGCTPQDMLSIDWLFRPKTLITADAIAESRNTPTYMYMFTWRSPLSKGSVHGAELMFCFNTLHHSKRDLPQPTKEDLKLADLMSNVWAKFAHDGNPNIEGLPLWKPYTVKEGDTMIFDYQCSVRNNPDRKLQQIINKHCFNQLDEFRKRNNQ
jgi:para-nitrobenzyl esterase